MRLTRIRDFPRHRRGRPADRALAARQGLPRARTASGGSASTTRPRTARCGPGRSPLRGDGAGARYAPKGDGAYLAGARAELRRRSTIDNPAPGGRPGGRSSARSGTRATSSPSTSGSRRGGTDDFEPKLSPDAAARRHAQGHVLLAAARHPARRARRDVHLAVHAPALQARTSSRSVEIMAALPSVVLGFLAGLWLAPRVEQACPGPGPDAWSCCRCWCCWPAALWNRAAARLPRPLPGRHARRCCSSFVAGARHRGSASRSRAGFERLAFGGNFQELAAARPPACPTTSATPWWSAWPWASR